MTRLELGDFFERLPSIDALGTLAVYPAVLSDQAGTATGQGAAISPNFFSLLGLRPMIGRGFDSADDRLGAENVVILSHTFWHERFVADSAVVGRQLILNSIPFRIVGVLPSEGAIGRPLFATDTATAQYFVPLGPYAARRGGARYSFTLMARLLPRMSVERLRRDLEVLLARSRADGFGASGALTVDAPRSASVLALDVAHAHAVTASPYVVFLGAMSVVLLAACASLAGLFVARLNRRRHEILVRVSLGARPWHVARQFSLEGAFCAASGGVLGVIGAAWTIGFARFLPPRGIPYWTSFKMDGLVAIFAAGLTGLCAVLVGVAPAMLALRRRFSISLREASAFAGVRRVRYQWYALIALQIQLALIFLAGAGVLGKAFLEAVGRDLGMAKRSVITAALPAGNMKSPEQQALADQVLERLRGLPGVVAVASRTVGSEFAGLTREGDPQMIGVSPPLHAEAVTSDYFRAWSIPLIHGRTIDKRDGAASLPVVVLDETTAKQLFPVGSAVGRRLALGEPSSGSTWMTIVGVVGTTHGLFPQRPQKFYPVLYQPFAQGFSSSSGLRFVVRTLGPAATMAPSVRAAFRDVAPNIPLLTLTSMETLIDQQLAPLRLNVTVISGLAIIVLVIAVMGVFGVVTQMANHRSAEVGLRIALGAQRASVVRLMMRSTVAAALVGIVSGLAATPALAGVIRALLYDTSRADPQPLIYAALVLAVTAVAAAYLPARRASRVDPSLALRDL